ncbi:uncharacterized protein LOC134538223 [Bacillus rossius redtenbacheri]|uniref:uncharacterized protein LOC134538223 n=1 Tax=Bacillus rossius redtenbacheri TaxID=93214 RepID=UPI002FDEF50D
MEVLHCYEFLLMRKLQANLTLWNELKARLLVSSYNSKALLAWLKSRMVASEYEETSDDDPPTYKNICVELWFLAVALEKHPHRLLQFVMHQVQLEKEDNTSVPGQTILARYLSHHNFVEMHLDSIFKYGETATLPPELFKCPNVRVLSLKCNSLDGIPPDVGRMASLERLCLTNNRLQNSSVPFTLTFCRRLAELYLDNNLLDALPGFLLAMPQLRTVHRHGNHNYFKATFMWYHTDVNERVLLVRGDALRRKPPALGSRDPPSLMFLAGQAIVASKWNFFQPGQLPPGVQDYLALIYPSFNVCGHCRSATPLASPGYKVFTFKNPYLGNTCVPFQHWACSARCAREIEVPAHLEQQQAAERMDREYRHYIREFQEETGPAVPSRGVCAVL